MNLMFSGALSPETTGLRLQRRPKKRANPDKDNVCPVIVPEEVMTADNLAGLEKMRQEDYLCYICSGLYRSPSTICGVHLACEACLKEYFGASGKRDCPTCHQGGETKDLQAVAFISLRMNRELKVKCPYDCQTFRDHTVSALIEHLSGQCPKLPAFCPDCHEPVARDDIKTHLSDQCRERPIPCPHCHVMYRPFQTPFMHGDACGRRRVLCALCGESYRQEDKPLHEQSCQEVVVSCKFCYSVQCARKDLIPMHLSLGQDFGCPGHPRCCPECGDYFGGKALQRHLRQCHRVSRYCPYKCDPAIKLRYPEMMQHLKTSCPLARFVCPYALGSQGCAAPPMARPQMEQHLGELADLHTELGNKLFLPRDMTPKLYPTDFSEGSSLLVRDISGLWRKARIVGETPDGGYKVEILGSRVTVLLDSANDRKVLHNDCGLWVPHAVEVMTSDLASDESSRMFAARVLQGLSFHLT